MGASVFTWEAFFAAFAVVIALASFVDRLWGRQRQRELQPLFDKMAHLDECLDRHRETSERFGAEVRLEFQSLRSQVTGLHVETLEKFATKDEVRELRDLGHVRGVR